MIIANKRVTISESLTFALDFVLLNFKFFLFSDTKTEKAPLGNVFSYLSHSSRLGFSIISLTNLISSSRFEVFVID